MGSGHRQPPPLPMHPPGSAFPVKPGLVGPSDMNKPKDSGRQHRRNLKSPCDRPPARPTGVQIRFRAVEAKTHLNFKGRIVWDDVTQDSSGFPINTVDRWDVEWRAVDGSGSPVEVEHAALTDATNPTGTVYRFTTARNHGWAVGDVVKVSGCYPQTNYNGTWTITAIGAPNRFDISGGTAGETDAKRPGEVYNQSTDQQFRRKLRNPVAKIALRSATHTTSPNKHHFTTRGTHGFAVGQKVAVSGCAPQTSYNGNWVIDTVGGDDTFTVLGGSGALADAETLGKVTDRDDFLHVVIPHLPRPKTWAWQARVRARSGEGCWSAFSAWTAAATPWEGANPKPPVPTYGASPLTFDHKGKGHNSKIRLIFTYDEVLNWDVPGGDREEDMAAYVIQLDSSPDGVTWDGAPYRTHHRAAKDGDADTTVTAVFKEGIHRHLWYRCRVRSKDRFHRVGDWSAWTPAAFPFDDNAPPTPLNVQRYAAHDRVIIEYDPPVINLPIRGTVSGTSGTGTLTGTGTKFTKEVEQGTWIIVGADRRLVKDVASDTSLTIKLTWSSTHTNTVPFVEEDDPDVAYYVRQMARQSDVVAGSPDVWNDVYRSSNGRGDMHAFRVAVGDEDSSFYVRVRAVDAAKNKSPWIYATIGGNSTPGTGGDSISMLRDVVMVEFPDRDDATTGPLRGMWRSDKDYRFKAIRATCGNHDGSHPTDGTPGGSPLKVNVHVISNMGGGGEADTAVLDSDSRVAIDPGEHSGALALGSGYAVTNISTGDYLYANVTSIGSSRPGRHLRITCVLIPAV